MYYAIDRSPTDLPPSILAAAADLERRFGTDRAVAMLADMGDASPLATLRKVAPTPPAVQPKPRVVDHRPRRASKADVRQALQRRLARAEELIAEWEARPQGSCCLDIVRREAARLRERLGGYAVDQHAPTRRMGR